LMSYVSPRTNLPPGWEERKSSDGRV